jgi:RHS repeat-associated protein
METKDKLYYYHNDINGAPLRLTDEAGNIVWNVHYNIFGKIDKLKINEVQNPIRMQGQYEDEETGLYYNRYRYYDPNISAYVSQDPLGLVAGENVYSYTKNSFGWIDPLGLSCETGGYKTGDVDKHGNLSPGINRADGHKNIASDGYVQSHHPVQNEWAKRWAKKNGMDYDPNKAPGVLLESSSGSPHAKVSSLQRQRRRIEGYDTDITHEFNTGYKELLDSGVDSKVAQKAMKDAYKYFDSIGGFVK